jgi:tripartite ATP-independent transporter DctP family solute receptor
MKKIFVLVLALGMLGSAALFAGGGGGEADEAKPIVMKLGETHAADYPTTMGDQRFADLVKERTNGRIIIEVYPAKQLGEETAVIEQVQIGAIEFTRVSVSPMAAFYKSFDALQMPYLYRNADHMWTVLNGPIGERFLKSVEAANFVGLCYYDGGQRSFYTKPPVTKPDDLRGLKIRVQESALMVGLVESFGAVAQPMPFGEVYSALQTGVIDGAENNFPSYDTTGHYEVAKYYIMDSHTRVPEILVASKIVFDKLSPEDQEIIKKAAKDSVEYQKKLWAEKVEVSRKKVEAAGCTITEVADNSAWQAAVQPMYDELSAELQAVVEEIRAVK